MKYCPYCGAEIAAEGSSYCAECGRELAFSRQATEKAAPRKRRKRSQRNVPEQDGYDGYYDDVLPEDADAQRGGVDKRLIKRIVLLALIAAAVISGCVAALYLL